MKTLNPVRYVVEVRTYGVWRPFTDRTTSKPYEFFHKGLAQQFADRLKTQHNLETQVA